MKNYRYFFRLIIVLALVLTFATITGNVSEKVTIPEELLREIPVPEDISVARSAYGVVTTSHPFATEAAMEVLEDGGNAYDAAVAASLVLGVVMPNAVGLDAEGVILTFNAKEGKPYLLNCNERAPGAAYPAMFLDISGNPLTKEEVYARGLCHGVGGITRGLDVMLKRWGTRYFDELTNRAIELAEDGWEIDRELSLRIHQTQDKLGPAAREVYMPDGKPLMPGELLVNKDLGHSLRLIAENGSGGFYKGEVAEATANFIQGLGGILTLDDFNRYNVRIEHPYQTVYKDYTLVGEQRNLLVYEFLEGFDVDELDPRSADRYHLFSEVWRLARADDGVRGDRAFHDIPFQGLMDEEYLQERRTLIDLEKKTEKFPAGNPWDYQVGEAYAISGLVPQVRDGLGVFKDMDYQFYEPDTNSNDDRKKTNNMIVVDAEGNVVTITQTLGVAWYAGNMVPGYGFMMNVVFNYFSHKPSSALDVNAAWPNKHERGGEEILATMLLKDGKPVIVAGTPGNQAAVFNVILNIVEFDMGVAEAVAEPRVSGTSWEDGISEEVLKELGEMGWKMKEKWSDQGCVQIIYWVDDEWIAAADARRDGWAMGVTK